MNSLIQGRKVAFIFTLALSCSSEKNSELKRVYNQAEVGHYATSFSLEDCGERTFLQFMKDDMYPAIVAESENRTRGDHIKGIEEGEGVELRLREDVSTYHVKYKAHWEHNAERSGRSFSAVGEKTDGKVEYVADASYAHYFDSFSRSLEFDTGFLWEFYGAIFGVLAHCDASLIDDLNKYQKRLAADFIAVYVAEQYRHLLGGEGRRLGRAHPWDNALLHTTMLISFHAGQETMTMYYKGEFTDRTYKQYDSVGGESFCAYKNWGDSRRHHLERRQAQLRDYWQPNRTCERSGVNITRRDFEKMGYALSDWHEEGESLGDLEQALQAIRPDLRSRNAYKNIASFFISDETPASLGDSAPIVVKAIVEFLLSVQDQAQETTESLL